MNAGKPEPRAELGEPAPHLGQRSTASMFDLRLSQLISLRCIPSGLHCKLEESSMLPQHCTCHARQRFWLAGCLGEGCAGPGSAGRCRLRTSRSITASPEPPANMAPLTPALPLPAGLPWRCPPAQPPPAAGVCLHRAGGAGVPAPGETGTHPPAARPPSIPAGRCSGRRGMKVMLAAGPGAGGSAGPRRLRGAEGGGWAPAVTGGGRW